MTPDRLRECIALPGWSLRELARRLDTDDGAVRQMARGKRPIGAELAAWLERIAATWSTLPPDLQEAGRLMGCDRGRFVRRPVNFRPLSDAEAAQLEAVAAFHLQAPLPDGWRS